MSQRPDALEGYTVKVQSPHGRIYVTLNFFDGEPVELFVTAGKSGGSLQALVQALYYLANELLETGTDLETIISMLRGISSDRTISYDGREIKSIPDAIAYGLDLILEGRGRDAEEA